MKRTKINCWQFRRCHRGPRSKSPCPAAVDASCSGANAGLNAGRICWTVSGTFCHGPDPEVFPEKRDLCADCPFFELVAKEEGEYFQPTKLAQGIDVIPDLQSRLSQVESLMAVHDRLLAGSDLPALLERITREAKKVTHARRSLVLLAKGNPPKLWGRFKVKGESQEVSIPIDENSVVGYVALNGKIVNVTNPYERSGAGGEEPAFNKSFDKTCNCKTQALLAVPIRDRNGKVIGVITAVNPSKGYFSQDDEWFLRKYAVEVALAVEKAGFLGEAVVAARLSSIGETVAALSHCIRNITHALRGASYVIKKGLERNRIEDIRTAWEIFDRNVEKLASLSTDVLTYNPDRRDEMAVSNLNDIIRDVIGLLSVEATAKAIKLESYLDSGLEQCYFSKRGIYRCLVNLIFNAFNACPPSGGTVAVRSRRTPTGEAVISVSDNGRGMDEKTRSEIFETFKTSDLTHGTGIGLPTVLDIVNKHHGRIEVDSEPGKGTTFRILIPVG